MLSAEVLWINDEAIRRLGGTYKDGMSRHDFLRRFAYGIQNTECFQNLTFDRTDNKLFLAERYGGKGVGDNGGGVRCGTDGPFQVKGIGTNCLVGDGEEFVHSYGGLDAPMAITESIFTIVLGKVLPIGTVDIYGLISTGPNAAYESKDKPCWGVLLVRESCVRPAHFLPAPDFNFTTVHRSLMKKDFARTRNAVRALRAQLKNDSQFTVFIGRFLANCANQFAFARVARILHGTISPSNISLDGRWLDMPLASFLNGGVNYATATYFYTEALSILEPLIELLDTYSKYNGVNLNASPLIDYYSEQLDGYFAYHIGFLIGISDEQSDEIVATNEWRTVATCADKIINSGGEVVFERAKADIDDPVACLVEGMFISLCAIERARPFLETAFKGEQYDFSELASAFRLVLTAASENGKTKYRDYKQFRLCAAIRALKRARFSTYFYLETIDSETRRLCESMNKEDVSRYIDECRDIADWVFGIDEQYVISLFQNDSVSIHYDIKEAFYVLDRQGASKDRFYDYGSLLDAIEQLERHHTMIRNLDFRPYLIRFKEVLCTLEAS